MELLRVTQEEINCFKELYELGENGDEIKKEELYEELIRLFHLKLTNKYGCTKDNLDTWHRCCFSYIINLAEEIIDEQKDGRWAGCILKRVIESSIEPECLEKLPFDSEGMTDGEFFLEVNRTVLPSITGSLKCPSDEAIECFLKLHALGADGEADKREELQRELIELFHEQLPMIYDGSKNSISKWRYFVLDYTEHLASNVATGYDIDSWLDDVLKCLVESSIKPELLKVDKKFMNFRRFIWHIYYCERDRFRPAKDLVDCFLEIDQLRAVEHKTQREELQRELIKLFHKQLPMKYGGKKEDLEVWSDFVFTFTIYLFRKNSYRYRYISETKSILKGLVESSIEPEFLEKLPRSTKANDYFGMIEDIYHIENGPLESESDSMIRTRYEQMLDYLNSSKFLYGM